jgi:hypothetical protein
MPHQIVFHQTETWKERFGGSGNRHNEKFSEQAWHCNKNYAGKQGLDQKHSHKRRHIGSDQSWSTHHRISGTHTG